MVSAYGFWLNRQRYGGKKASDFYHFLLETEKYSKEELRNYQLIQLKKVIKTALTKVPYYINYFEKPVSLSEKLEKINDVVEILSHFPVITKETILENEKQFINADMSRKSLLRLSTSGTTGTPLNIFLTKDELRKSYAFYNRFRNWMGVRLGQRRATFGGRTIVDAGEEKPPYWRYDLSEKNLYLSSYHISDKTIPLYLDAINRWKPVHFVSYPSSIYQIAHYVLEKKRTIHAPKAVTTSSETLYSHQRDAITRAFNTKVYDWYGNTEMTVFASQCSLGTYHVNSEYSIIEIDDSDEAISSCLFKFAMPLIRYQTGDSVKMEPHGFTCKCGRNFPAIKEISGRIDDYIVTPDGKKIGRLDPVLKGVTGICEMQIIQKDAFHVELKVVKSPSFTSSSEKLLMKNLTDRIGYRMNLHFKYVNSIPKLKSGKFKAVMNMMNSSD
jgi:phenylacetate-CoA ligase